jgi:predicted dehydrogenase
MSDHVWKVAIIGCGSFAGGQYLMKVNQMRHAKLVAVCDILPERARVYAARAGIDEWYLSIDELLEKSDFEILMNATSIPAHHEINMKALAAGKHVFTQKPAGLSVEAVTAQIDAAAKAGLKMNAAPVHAMRHANRVARKLIADGVIGKVTTIRCQVAHGGPEYFQYRDVDPSWFYEPGSGALFDMGVHGLHYVTDLAGPAKAVNCMGAVSEPERMVRSGAFDGKMIESDKLPDNFIITLDFGDGCIGEVYTGYCQRATRMPPMEIYGTQGTISFVCDPGEARPHLEVYTDHRDWGIRGWTRPMDQLERKREFYDGMCLQDLIDAIEQDRQPVLSMERQRHLVEIMCAVPACIESGQTMPLSTTF